MRRLPIRARLTAAFALAMIAVLAGAGIFVYLRLQDDLDDAIDDGLARRARAIATAPDPPRVEPGAPSDRQDGVAQIIAANGHVIDSATGYDKPALSGGALRRATEQATLVERQIAGIDGITRILARPRDRPGGAVIAVGQSLEDRDETLSNLITSFAVGGPVAVAIASLLGYLLATAGLAPIEAMRRRAGQISPRRGDELLPLPAARDEVRRLGETLNEMLGRLRAAFERERRFVADASHELRTPIAVIKAELEHALRTSELGPAPREAVLAAVEECDSLAALAEDMLVIARAGEGQLPVRAEEVDARVLLEGVRDRFIERAAQRGRTIRLEVESGLALRVDPVRMRQALGNLVDNALRHGAGTVVIGAHVTGGSIELAVSDAGPGVDPGIAEHAFDRFARGDGARTRGGSGLGLAIVRAIAEAHGGTAEIVSRDGAEVRLRLPGERQVPQPPRRSLRVRT